MFFLNSYLKGVLLILTKVFLLSITLSFAMFLAQRIYYLGYSIGFREGQVNAQDYYVGLFEDLSKEKVKVEEEPAVITKPSSNTPTPAPSASTSNLIKDVSWGGPELWDAVNDKREEYGVNPLSSRSELCTIASIRLNELLALGTLDGHEGFTNLEERRPDLKWVFEKYSKLAEFLLAGAQTPQEAVALWENTLGHKQLLTGGEYVWGCIYAQNSFAVAISAY